MRERTPTDNHTPFPEMDSDLRARIQESLVEYPDFPKPGVIFQVPAAGPSSGVSAPHTAGGTLLPRSHANRTSFLSSGSPASCGPL